MCSVKATGSRPRTENRKRTEAAIAASPRRTKHHLFAAAITIDPGVGRALLCLSGRFARLRCWLAKDAARGWSQRCVMIRAPCVRSASGAGAVGAFWGFPSRFASIPLAAPAGSGELPSGCLFQEGSREQYTEGAAVKVLCVEDAASCRERQHKHTRGPSRLPPKPRHCPRNPPPKTTNQTAKPPRATSCSQDGAEKRGCTDCTTTAAHAGPAKCREAWLSPPCRGNAAKTHQNAPRRTSTASHGDQPPGLRK